MQNHPAVSAPLTRRGRAQLTEVMLGSNPAPASRWTQSTGGQADIAGAGFLEQGDWSVSCNQDRIGRGTIGIFARTGDGGVPPLAGFMVCTEEPQQQEVVDGEGNPQLQWSVKGRLHGWDERLWVPGVEIEAAGWPTTRSPWGTTSVRQFRNGERLTRELVRVILSAIPESLVRMMAMEAKGVTRSYPWWW